MTNPNPKPQLQPRPGLLWRSDFDPETDPDASIAEEIFHSQLLDALPVPDAQNGGTLA
jgi:hypothetical protein